MTIERIVPITEDFWNIRGSFKKLLNLLDLGTHASLVRLAPDDFVLLDSYTLSGDVSKGVMQRTRYGKDVSAIINLHPFHTLHVEAIARTFPHAKLYGTARHHAKFPELPWQPELTETPEFAALYAEHFDFLVPPGVHFVPKNENLHFASVLAIHKKSKVLHVDDTLNWVPIPLNAKLSFHPTLKRVLAQEPGAAAAFRAWAQDLATRCEDVEHICTAHARLNPLSDDPPGGIARRVRDALEDVEPVLTAHDKKHGARSSGGSL